MVSALAGLIVAIAPNISGILARKFPEAKADIEDTTSALVQVLGMVSLLSGGAAVANRATAKDRVYTPTWLPGFGKEDCEKPLTQSIVRPSATDDGMHERMGQLIEQQSRKAASTDSDRVSVSISERVVSNPADAI
jgi:hypothetical protein